MFELIQGPAEMLQTCEIVCFKRRKKNAPLNKIPNYYSMVRQLGCLEPRRSQAKLTWRENAVKC